MSVIGVDFGNLSLLIAQAGKGGVDVILNSSSNRQTATCVSIQGKQRFIGDEGAALARTNIKNTISCMKLLVGRKFDEEDVQHELRKAPFTAVKLPHGGVGISVIYNDEPVVISAEHFLAMMLEKAKGIAKFANNNVGVGEAVLAVPYWYTDAQRRAMMVACEIAGLNCLKVCNESTAIALSFGIYKSAKKLFSETEPTHVMFIDIGYTCYSVTIVDFIQEKLQVLSTVCDSKLGGRDFDDVIIDFLIEEFERKTRLNVRGNVKALLKLQVAAEKAKKTLSPTGVNEAAISVECLSEEHDLNTKLTKEEFEARAAPVVQRLRAPIEQCLAEARLTAAQLADIEIVGGSSRIGLIKRVLADILGLDTSLVNNGLKTTMNSDEAVARGAALQCAILSSKMKVKPFNIIDKVPLPIVVYFSESDASSSAEGKGDDEDEDADGEAPSNSGGVSSVAIYQRGDDFPRNPRRITFRRKNADFSFTAAYPDYATPLLPVGQDKHIATYTVKIPAGKDPNDVRVTFNLDRNGCLFVSSAVMMEPLPDEPPAEVKEGEEAPKPKKKFSKTPLVVETSSFGLNKKEIQEAIELEATMANEDRLITETADRRNDLEAYIYAMRDKLPGVLKPFASESEKAQLTQLLTDAEDWLYGDGFDSTKALYTSRLNELKVIGDRIETRNYESDNRKSSIDAMKKQLDMCKAFAANSGAEQYAHITPEEREKVKTETNNAEEWMYDMLNKQGDLQQHQDPILTLASIEQKRRELYNNTNPIISKPKPAPKPAPKPEESKEEGEAPMDEGAGAAGENQSKADEKSEPMEN